MSTSRFYTPDELATWVPFAALLELLPRELDGQLLRDEDLTHFDYFTLSMLTNAKEHRLRMTELASMTNATLPRLSHVVTRLEKRGFVRREPCADDARATNAVITAEGRKKVLHATTGHVANVRRIFLDALTAEQARELRTITRAVLERVDPEGKMAATQR
ncbi:MAG: MarR family transcriptional regulator [Microbacterium sp. SCN 70-200]|uniref:MarR family winged helix-turn-helix transcriptional regulator n=1 Tax=unclassified Microbacterium TaxID=2609290 RepID=UPI00086DBE14|nr:MULTISPECIES: MarR family transcriptional regulator [unclassified Microbacterium]MBN9214548.1 MarR family transcriptional regulator [Microbacterium sp.]ODT41442.1 MAG: MarR family transcriptional regulator [Microbacterium sp. SCN 70-200]OJV84078.1 MAG: MarR family transcriptional regulator [Microbacterium sp. 70-16]